jgi:nitroreductase
MFMSLVEKRRSIRRFEDRPVEADRVNLLIEAALRSPSSMGRNPWEFVVVSERQTLERLASAKPHGATFLKDAPLGIVVCADPEKCDVWIEDASIASVFIHLAAESLGLGSCWIQIRERMHESGSTAEAHVAKVLNLPEDLHVESIVAVGYPAEQKPPHSRDGLQFEKVHSESYGRPFEKKE